ncbi:MAG TPA: hypothetical protein VGE41_02705 [Verrucomicrobiae bacterium]
MINRMLNDIAVLNENLIATFGRAELVKVQDRLCLRGGSAHERLEALEWISLFLPGEFAELDKQAPDAFAN